MIRFTAATMKVGFIILVATVCGLATETRAGLFDGLVGAARDMAGTAAQRMAGAAHGVAEAATHTMEGAVDGMAGAAQGVAEVAHGAIETAGQVTGILPYGDIVAKDFEKYMFDFALRLYKRVAFYNKDHFVVSPLSMWLSLAALAEGSDGAYRRQLFEALNLPEDRVLREKYYALALSRERPGNDVRFTRKRLLVLDQGLQVNSSWADYVKRMNLLETSFAPIKNSPVDVATQLRGFIGAKSFPQLGGNSILVDCLDYEAMWTTAFPEARIERAPFYNEAGVELGMVDYLKIKKRVRLAHLPLIGAKILDLPVGENGRYRMMFALGLSHDSMRNSMEKLVNSLLKELLSLLRESLIPLEIAIPRFALNFEYDASGILEELGAGSIFKQPEASWLVSNPPAQPTGYYQRTSIKIDSPGLTASAADLENGSSGLFSPLVDAASDLATGLAAVIGRDFIANKPFMFGLLDSETNTVLFGGAYSFPTV